MKKILFVCSLFAPDNTIGAIRSTKFAKYLSLSENYEITVIKEKKIELIIDENLKNDIKHIDFLYEIDCGKKAFIFKKIVNRLMKTSSYHKYSTNKRKIEQGKIKKSKSFKQWLAKRIIDKMHYLNEKGFSKKAIKFIKKNKETYDIVFSTYGPISNHNISYKIKKKKIAKKWIVDYRDPVIYESYSNFYSKYIYKSNKLALENGDKIIFCSNGCKKMFDNGFERREDFCLITNGYDLFDKYDMKYTNNSVFHLCYCGELYANKRDFSILFKCLKELIDEGKILKDKITIDYAGKSSNDMEYQVSKYDLFDCLNNYGFVPRKEAIRLQNETNLLLLASWNNDDETGVLTGKFLEYLMMNKPIVAVISGNKSNSDIKKMMAEGNLGACCEESCLEDDYSKLKRFILEKYNEFIKNGKTTFYPNDDFIQKYNYINLTKKLEKIIEEI